MLDVSALESSIRQSTVEYQRSIEQAVTSYQSSLQTALNNYQSTIAGPVAKESLIDSAGVSFLTDVLKSATAAFASSIQILTTENTNEGD